MEKTKLVIIGYFIIIAMGLPKNIIADEFAFSLYKQFEKSDRNIIISPFATTYAFAIAYLGSKGVTATEFSNVFRFNQNTFDSISPLILSIRNMQDISDKGQVEIYTAAALWPSKIISIDSNFKKKSDEMLRSKMNQLDYSNPTEVCHLVNSWAASITKGKFNSIISPSDISDVSNLILTSAIYFKGKWKYPFQKQATKDMPFYPRKNEQIEVKMMNQKSYFGYGENDSIQILKLSYVDENLSMIIVLPRAIDGLERLSESTMLDSIGEWSKNLQTSKIEVFLPRFKFSKRADLTTSLKQMGIESAFDYKKADFSGITGKNDSLFLEKVIQNATIEVNEEGTEASAIDAILMGVGGLGSPPPCPVFKADRPFLFLIKEENTNVVLFMGKVTNPLKG